VAEVVIEGEGGAGGGLPATGPALLTQPDVTLTEGGPGATYTIGLATKPTANVTVHIVSDDQVSPSLDQIEFTLAEWDDVWTVDVTAEQDDLVEGDHMGVITHTAESDDPIYNGILIGTLTAEITDDESPLAAVSFAFTDAAGSPISQVHVGDDLRIYVYGQDLRTAADGRGVAAAALDVLYNTAVIDVTGIVHLAPFDSTTSGTVDEPSGLIDEAGGGLMTSPRINRAQQPLFYLEATATAMGTLLVEANAGEDPGSSIKLQGMSSDVRASTDYGSGSLPVVADADLVATTLDALPDHVLAGQTTLDFTIENAGEAPAGPFHVDLVLSMDGTVGNGDDVVLETRSYGGLPAGQSLSDSTAVQLPLDVLYAAAQLDDPAGMGGGYVSGSFAFVGVVVDSADDVPETDETNNSNQGKGLDMDDVTYFPWDVNDNGLVTATDAIFLINRLNETVPPADARADLDGNGQVTSSEAMAVINRLEYVINEGVIEAESQAAEPAGSGSANTVQATLNLVDLNGVPGIYVGESFDIELNFADTSEAGNPQAVFAGYADLAFDPLLLRVDSVSYDADFSVGRKGTIDNDSGSVDALGAVGNISAASETLVCTLHVTAVGRGATTITSTSNAGLFAEIAVYGVDGDQRTATDFGSLEVQINAPVEVDLTLVDPDGVPGIRVGESFDVEVDFTDVRNPADPQAVFSGYVDMLFDSSLLQVDGVTYDPNYPAGQRGTIDNQSGQLDEMGAAGGTTPAADTCLFTVHLTAIGEGTSWIITEQADDTAAEITFYGDDSDQRQHATFGELEIEVNARAAQVVGRHVFYNDSHFDGDDAAANALDDDAIAPFKQALFPGGGQATFANYTSYDKGINGLIVDITMLADPDGLTTGTINDYFTFATGNDHTPGDWDTAPNPTEVAVRNHPTDAGVKRVTLIWDEAVSVKKAWLEVTVLASLPTGLVDEDVFYFGNAIGECGDATAFTFVDGTDFAAARDNTHDADDRAPIDDRFDYNRDSLVDSTDLAIARDNHTNFLTCLTLFTAPPLGGSSSSSPSNSWASPATQLSQVSSSADHEPGARAAVSGSDWPTHWPVNRPYMRPTTRQPADLPQQLTEDLDPQTVSAVFQNQRTDGSAYASDNTLQTTRDRWHHAVDDYFRNEESDLFTW